MSNETMANALMLTEEERPAPAPAVALEETSTETLDSEVPEENNTTGGHTVQNQIDEISAIVGMNDETTSESPPPATASVQVGAAGPSTMQGYPDPPDTSNFAYFAHVNFADSGDPDLQEAIAQSLAAAPDTDEALRVDLTGSGPIGRRVPGKSANGKTPVRSSKKRLFED